MNEVEKMYENAGCELGCCKYAEYDYEGEEGTWYYCKKEGTESAGHIPEETLIVLKKLIHHLQPRNR